MIEPMLCKLGDLSFLSKKFIFEPKLDGTRAVCYYQNNKIKLINRRDKDITTRYPELNFKKNLKCRNCILDGEIIVYNKKGNPSFNLLQKRDQLSNKFMIEIRSREYPATYVVFDILKKDGKNLMSLPLIERKKILEKTIISSSRIDVIPYTTEGKKLWREIKKRKLEGVIAKNPLSKYYPGKRTPEWIKIKFLKTIDCVIIGYTSEKRAISSLVLGAYDKGKLRYIGRVGTGFTEKFLEELYEKLKPLKTNKPVAEYSGRKEIQWIKPKIVCEIRYLEFTKDKMIRAGVFLRLRNDKKPKDCILEIA